VLLDEGTRARQQSVAAAGESAEEQLKAYGIRFWGDKRYYVNDKGHLRWEAIVGVLMTGILMSFGAPFWFNQLRYLASLRDVKAPLPTPDK
jgi:hypothetical protein